MIEPHTPPVVDIDAMALATAKQIASVNPNQAGGATQALAQIQNLVRGAMEQYRPYDHLSRVRRHLQDAQAVATRELERANYLADQAGKLEKRCAELDYSNQQRQRVIEEKDRERVRLEDELDAGKAIMASNNELMVTYRDQAAKNGSLVSDLALLAARLSYQLNKARPGNEFSRRATTYLQKHSLIGSPLREADMELRSTEGDAVEQLQQALAALEVLRDPVTAAHYAMSRLTPEGIADYLDDHREVWAIVAGEVEAREEGRPEDAQDADQAQQDAMGRQGVVDPNAWMRGDQWTADELEQIQGRTVVCDLAAEGSDRAVEQIVTVAEKATDDPGIVTLTYEGPERRSDRKPVMIPGAVWPVPGQTGFKFGDKTDPFCAQNRHLPFKGRRHDDD